MARVTSLGALTASIAHEVNQPLSGIITNASTCLRMLAADPPNVEGARETARRTIRDGNRAADVITRLRALFSKKDITTEPVDLNEATREVIALSLSELQRKPGDPAARTCRRPPACHGRSCPASAGHPEPVLNASDAMSSVDDRPRQLVIRTERDEEDHVRLSVQDAGWVSTRKVRTDFSTRSTPPRVTAWESACPSVAPLSKVIMAVYGQHRMMVREPRFHSLFRADPSCE